VQGEISVNIRNGRLLNIEPGAGRLFGLFSWQALPRRLALDFSDFFQKGFKFDTINGDFSVNHGNARTANLVIEGPAAVVEVSGRTGLTKRDYDQVVTVVPSLGSSLPWLGVLASGEPQLGAVIFLTQKLFDAQLKDLARYTYALSGPWDNPLIKAIKSPPDYSIFEEPALGELN